MSASTKNPPKHLVREYLARRTRDSQPPPTPEEIRRQLGWGMVDEEAHDSSRQAQAEVVFG